MADPRALAQEAREKAERATEGPWVHTDGPVEVLHWGVIRSQTVDARDVDQNICSVATDRHDDFAFIAYARSAVPALADAVEGLVAENERLQTERDRAWRLYDEEGTRRVTTFMDLRRKVERIEAERDAILDAANVRQGLNAAEVERLRAENERFRDGLKAIAGGLLGGGNAQYHAQELLRSLGAPCTPSTGGAG